MSDPRRHFSDHFDGTLSEEGRRELNEYIKSDPRHAEEFVAAAFLHTRLREKFRGWGNSDSSMNDAQILPAITEEEAEREAGTVDVFAQTAMHADRPVYRRERHVVRGFVKKAWPIAAGLFAALIGAGVWQWAANRPVGTVVREVDARWGTPGLVEGSRVRGEIKLQSGLAEIALDPGATVVLEGPALARVTSGSHLELVYGKVTTNVPAAAVGFTVTTGRTSVVDLGTEVGIDAREDRPLHVEVFKGKAAVQVSAQSASAERKVLTASMAVAVEDGHIQDAPVMPLAFVRTGDLQAGVDPDGASQRWRSFSERLRRDPSVVAYYPFDNATEAPLRLLNRAEGANGNFDGDVAGPHWDEGRQPAHAALRFEGKDDRVSINIPGEQKELTVAQWIRLSGEQGSHADLLMTQRNGGTSAFHWQFADWGSPPMKLNLYTQVPGTFMEWTSHVFPVGFDIADDRWHFVAFTFDGNSRTVQAYMDGRRLGKQHEPNLSALTINSAEIGNFRPDGRRYAEVMHGRMDEMVIWKRVVSGEELAAMYAAGSAK
ncbi:MAG: LamG-like jellyroll fold domain-containing protein [Phycisphaerae bacterium]